LWNTNGGVVVGRTELSGQVAVGSGSAQLGVNTYSPDYPGTNLLGSQIESVPSFQPTNGSTVTFTTQLQLQSLQPGLVYGMYFYDCGNTCVNYSDEIDIELATNELQSGAPMEVELNWFVNGSPDTGDGGFVALPGNFNPLAVHDWTISWSAGEIDYYVDGLLLESVTNAAQIPDSQLHVNEIAFAPNSNWGAAYYSGLQPDASPVGSQEFAAALDSVTVSESPEPSTLVLLLPAVPILYWRRKSAPGDR
jgi:hypothetical protein